jgi:hypothetical protein
MRWQESILQLTDTAVNTIWRDYLTIRSKERGDLREVILGPSLLAEHQVGIALSMVALLAIYKAATQTA